MYEGSSNTCIACPTLVLMQALQCSNGNYYSTFYLPGVGSFGERILASCTHRYL